MSAESHLDMPGVRIAFALPDGPALQRCWTWRDVFEGRAPDWLFAPDPPWWLMGKGTAEAPEVSWKDPLLPIVFHGRVNPAYVDVARAWIAEAGGQED